MIVFGNDSSMPGCFAKAKRSGGSNGAVFRLKGFGGSDGSSIVTGFRFNQKDDYVPVKCIGDVAYINVFGRAAVAEATVTFTLFLIRNTSYTGVLDTIKGAFKSKRLSSKGRQECNITVGSRTLVTAYAAELNMSADSQLNGVANAECKLVSLKDR